MNGFSCIYVMKVETWLSGHGTWGAYRTIWLQKAKRVSRTTKSNRYLGCKG